MQLFQSKYGIIVACDVRTNDELGKLVKATSDLDFIQGYKIGAIATKRASLDGLIKQVQIVRENAKSDKIALIYDHQKYPTDIPDTCGGDYPQMLKETGFEGTIVFPLTGPFTSEESITACKAAGLVPIVGGEMTHKGYLVSEGGYIADDSPERMYKDAVAIGRKIGYPVEYFVVPGTKPESMRKYRTILKREVEAPRFLFPGIGKGQGGDIVLAFKAVAPFSAYAIVGRGIYAQENPRDAAIRLWDTVRAQSGLIC